MLASPVPDREQWIAGLKVMLAHPTHQAEFLRAAARAEEALAAAVGARTGTDPATDLYPKLVAGAVLAAVNATSSLWVGGGATEDVGELVDDGLCQLAAGLPPPH